MTRAGVDTAVQQCGVGLCSFQGFVLFWWCGFSFMNGNQPSSGRLSGMTFSCSWPQTHIYSVSIITKWIEFGAVILCSKIKHVFVFEPWPLNSHWPLSDVMFSFLCAWRCKIVFYSDLCAASFSHCMICGLHWHPPQCCPSTSKLPCLQVPILCSFPNLMLFSSYNKVLVSVSFGMFPLPAEELTGFIIAVTSAVVQGAPPFGL